MDITITIPDENYQLVQDAFKNTQGYQDNVGVDDAGNPIPNPQSVDDFMLQVFESYINTLVTLYQRNQAAQSFTPTTVAIARPELAAMQLKKGGAVQAPAQPTVQQ